MVVTAKTRGQAYEVIDKIEKILIPKSSLLRSEINFKRSAFNLQKAEVVFYNTSCIRVVTANDNSRHFRANVLLVDEYRMIPLDTLNTVLREFLVGSRDAGYLRKPQYRHLAERNMELYASSCWYTSHWSYQLAQDYLNNMMTEGKKYTICGLPYQLAVRDGIQSKEAIEDKMTESTFSAVKFQMESEALWFSDTDGGLYSYSDISRTCKIDYPMFPSSVTELIRDQKIVIPPKRSGEYRILSADIAVMASSGSKSNNDATSLFINQMTPTQSGRYLNNIVYTENYEGAHTEDQALIIRKMFEEYDCDYIAIDARGVGWGVVDLLLRDQVDYATGQIYPALSCCNDDDIAARCSNPRAQKAIWAIKGNAQFNSDCALGLREAFRQGTIRLLRGTALRHQRVGQALPRRAAGAAYALCQYLPPGQRAHQSRVRGQGQRYQSTRKIRYAEGPVQFPELQPVRGTRAGAAAAEAEAYGRRRRYCPFQGAGDQIIQHRKEAMSDRREKKRGRGGSSRRIRRRDRGAAEAERSL